MSRTWWPIVTAIIAGLALTATCDVVQADPGVPVRQHTCVTHAGDLPEQLAQSLALWGRYSNVRDCGVVPDNHGAPYPDIILSCIDNPSQGHRGQTFPYVEYAFIAIYQCQLPPAELQALVDHEVGHALGLDHDPEPGVLMSEFPHGPFTCTEARRIAALYPPGTSAPCSPRTTMTATATETPGRTATPVVPKPRPYRQYVVSVTRDPGP